nr:integrase, catalytic region, zinc finger, CCHC-type, peptidase aspartic, catalytic [Tanacetum cinerariifolium]
MMGNRALLTNSVQKFLGTVRFGNNDFAVIVGYGDVAIRSMTIKKVYYVEVGTSFASGNSITGSGNALCILFPSPSRSKLNKSLLRIVCKWLPNLHPLAELVAKWIPKVKRQIDKISKTPNSSGPIFKWVPKVC